MQEHTNATIALMQTYTSIYSTREDNSLEYRIYIQGLAEQAQWALFCHPRRASGFVVRFTEKLQQQSKVMRISKSTSSSYVWNLLMTAEAFAIFPAELVKSSSLPRSLVTSCPRVVDYDNATFVSSPWAKHHPGCASCDSMTNSCDFGYPSISIIDFKLLKSHSALVLSSSQWKWKGVTITIGNLPFVMSDWRALSRSSFLSDILLVARL